MLTEVLIKSRELNVQQNAIKGASKNGNLGECSFKIVAYPNPCNPCELVTYVLESVKKIRCHTALNKTLVTSEQLQKLYRKL